MSPVIDRRDVVSHEKILQDLIDLGGIGGIATIRRAPDLPGSPQVNPLLADIS
jgi:hypothetical protein